MSDAESIVIYAVVFLILFFIGGFVGMASLPDFPGRFLVSGVVVGAFGTGAGSLIIHAVVDR